MKQIEVKSILEKVNNISNLVFIDQGGQKAVFRGLHKDFGEVVIKIIIEPNERIRREIEIAVDYEIPNTARLLAIEYFEYDSLPAICVIEEYVKGVNLREEIQEKEQLPIKQVISLINTLLETAVYLESEKLVHRDIKPENIMVCPDGSFILLDFGIARLLSKSSLTPNEAQFGPYSPGYAAPEQFRNLKKNIDIRTDLFAIGIVAYEAISGKHPFAEGARDSFDLQRRTEILNPSLLIIKGDDHSELAKFIAILMEKFPSRRPPTAFYAQNWFKTISDSMNINSS